MLIRRFKLMIALVVLVAGMSYSGNLQAQERNSDWKIISTSFNNTSAEAPFTFLSKQHKVQLSWQGLNRNDISHYIIEHSKDGKKFSQLAVFFTDTNYEGPLQYEYSFAVPYKLCYYRLVTVTNSGDVKRSTVQKYAKQKL